MTHSATYLIDTSALVRLLAGEVTELWERPQHNGLIAVCDLTELEVLYSARSVADRLRVLDRLDAVFPWVAVPDRVYDRARQVQQELTMRGWHRSAGPVDLLLAAAAELSKLTLLHQDRDFETIASVTQQPTRWLVPPEEG